MLCNANFNGQGFPWGGWFEGGYDSDFSTNWFEAFGGTIIGAMTFNIWFPLVSEFMWIAKRNLTRCNDKRKSPSDAATACTT